MKKIEIYQLANKKSLWGSVDSEKVFNILNEHINNNPKNSEIVDIDFSNISSIDYSFIKKVFIELINIHVLNDMKFVFSNISNYEIVYHLDEVFKIHKYSAFINIDNRVNPIGANKMDLESSFTFLEKNQIS